MLKNFLTAALVLMLATIATFVSAEQGNDTLHFVPHNYSPYHAERSQLSQSREELSIPYNSSPTFVEPPQQSRPYAVLPPSNGNYGYSSNRPYSGGGYPYYGNQYGGGYGAPWGGVPGGWGGMPWGGGSPFGGSPFGGSPWGNSFNWFGSPGMAPFGW